MTPFRPPTMEGNAKRYPVDWIADVPDYLVHKRRMLTRKGIPLSKAVLRRPLVLKMWDMRLALTNRPKDDIIYCSVDEKLHLTPVKAAKELGVSERTIRRWLSRGKVKAIKTPGGRWWISKQWVSEHKGFGVEG